jgi:hypothetical protein
MRLIMIILFGAWFIAPAAAQIQRIMHRAFELGDSILVVELDIHGDYTVVSWAGDNILFETQIKLYNASASILNHFVEEGRYDLEARMMDAQTLRLASRDQERITIRTRRGECFEEVSQRLFLPSEFKVHGPDLWRRPSPKSPDDEEQE